MGPTSANQQPIRIVWVKSDDGIAKLVDCASDGNKDKIKAAPVTAVLGYDIDFHENLPWLFPHADAKSWFEGDEEGRIESAKRNSALQGAYLIIAARAVGLDCGPMSGVDLDAVTKEFFADQPRVKADWICSIGYGDPESLFDRSPRPEFDTLQQLRLTPVFRPRTVRNANAGDRMRDRSVQRRAVRRPRPAGKPASGAGSRPCRTAGPDDRHPARSR